MKCKLFVKDNIEDLYNCDLEGLDFVFLIFKGEISLIEELEEPVISRELCQLSKENSFILFFHFVASINNKRYLSVMVIDNGKILGISDSVTTKDYCNASRQRIYMTSRFRTGVVVDADIFHTDSVSSLCQNKAQIIVFMSFEKFSNKFLKAFTGHKFFNDISILAAFSDKLCYFDKEMDSIDIEKGYDFEIVSNFPNEQNQKLQSPTFEY